MKFKISINNCYRVINKTNIIKIFAFIFIFNILATIIFPILATSTTTISPNFYSKHIILMDNDSSNVLLNKDGYTRVFPASTTKIMTAILSIEKLDVNSAVVASKSAIESIPSDSSTANIKVGEVLSIEKLLYCLLLPSGNDAANVLAEAVSGNVEDFIKLMNQKAKEIGCLDTHFNNAHGYHDDNHYSTPYDMVKIMQYAMKSEEFRKICETSTYTIDSTNKTENIRELENSNDLIIPDSKEYYEYAVGGKTGYTLEARCTFVGYAKKDGKTLIVGTFDGPIKINKTSARNIDSVSAFNYGFENFSNQTIISKKDCTYKLTDKENSLIYTVQIPEDVISLVDNNYTVNYDLNIDYNKMYNIKKLNDSNLDTNVGNITYTIKSDLLDIKNNVALKVTNIDNYIIYSGFTYNILYITIFIIVILISIILFIIFRKNKAIKKGDKDNLLNILKQKHRNN